MRKNINLTFGWNSSKMSKYFCKLKIKCSSMLETVLHEHASMTAFVKASFGSRYTFPFFWMVEHGNSFRCRNITFSHLETRHALHTKFNEPFVKHVSQVVELLCVWTFCELLNELHEHQFPCTTIFNWTKIHTLWLLCFLCSTLLWCYPFHRLGWWRCPSGTQLSQCSFLVKSFRIF